jgi:hypothetical protein
MQPALVIPRFRVKYLEAVWAKKLQKRISKTYCSMNFLIYATTFGHTQIHTATGIWELSAPATHTLILRDLSANSGYNFN